MRFTDAPVEIAEYDSGWPVQFRDEARDLQRVLGTWLEGPVEHIGSTAVPGLAAKPVIDIMAGVPSLDASRPAIAAAATLGYCYFPYSSDIKHWFCKPSAAFRTHHLHLVPMGSPQWLRPLAFRDFLRKNPAVAAEYEQLKRELALRFRLDREAYTDAKEPFVSAITDQAIASGYGL